MIPVGPIVRGRSRCNEADDCTLAVRYNVLMPKSRPCRFAGVVAALRA